MMTLDSKKKQELIDAGYQASANNQMRAPGLNPLVVETVSGLKVGDPLVKEAMEAFNTGWELHSAKELAELGF